MNPVKDPYVQAASVLPKNLRIAALQLPQQLQCVAEEFRLRSGQCLSVLAADAEIELQGTAVTGEDLSLILGQASHYSAHTVQEQVCAGYLSIQGGHRLGICGEAALKNGTIHAIRTISSMALRIARQTEGVGAMVVEKLTDKSGSIRNTLILAPPGVGKTTLLREVVRRISDGIGVSPCRVGLADERRELSAMWNGQAQFDVGEKTDVMVDCSKADAVQILLRGMNPQVIAMDEITAEEDLEALLWAAGCGVRLLATAHGENIKSLRCRPLYRRLLEERLFEQVVVLQQQGSRRSFYTEVII